MNQKAPKVSVVTVTYNAKQFLEETIKSVIGQDYPDIEYIIIDGGSGDGTTDIIKKYEKYISYWISESDGGIYDAMNKGIEVATGDWINFMNAGDSFVSNDTVSKVIKNRKEDVDIIFSHTNIIDPKTKTNLIYEADLDVIYSRIPCFHQAQFIKTGILKRIKYDTNYNIAADYNFLIQCYREGYLFQIVDLKTANYLMGGFSQVYFEKGMLEAIKILSHHCVGDDIILNSGWMQQLVKHRSKSFRNILFSEQFNLYSTQLYNLNKKYDHIAIYGYGTIGKNIHSMLQDRICLICDQTFDKKGEERLYCHPSELKEYKFDIIIISVLGREAEITDYITNLGIEKNKIFQFNFEL